MNNLDLALDYASKGYWVFPLRPGRKTPATKSGHYDATADETKIREWWTKNPNANIGIYTAPSGLIVVDLDVKSGDGIGNWAALVQRSGLLLDPFVVETSSGGQHHYYRGAPVGGRIGLVDSVDIKSMGGYVVAPGSVLDGTDPDGKDVAGAYTVRSAEVLPRTSELPEASEGLRTLLTSRKTPTEAGGTTSAGETLADLLQFPPKEGGRNHWLTRVAGHLAKSALAFNDYAHLVDVANQTCQPPLGGIELANITRNIWEAEESKLAQVESKAVERPAALVDVFTGTEGFWESRESLRLVRQAALHRRTAPWAVLGAVVANVLTSIPPHVVLPATVGGVASLNSFVAMVGPSGAGKGAAEDVARDLVHIEDGEIHTEPVGSGEGLVKSYGKADKDGNLEMERYAVLFTSDEIDTMAALSARHGSTLMPMLRLMWSGKEAGFRNADRAKTVVLPAHEYRLCLITGVQPGRAEALLGDADGGTPQRFLWFPVQDPTLTQEDLDRTQWTGEQLEIRHPWTFEAGTERVALQIPDTVRAEVLSRRDAVLLGQAANLDGHSQLTRMKLAMALAVMDGRDYMDDEDWRLSGVALDLSNRARAWVQQELNESIRNDARRKGTVEGVRRDASFEASDNERQRRFIDRIIRHVDNAGEDGLPEGLLWKKFKSTERDFAKEVGASLLGGVLVRRTVNGYERLFRQ